MGLSQGVITFGCIELLERWPHLPLAAQISQVLLNILNNSSDAIALSENPWIEISFDFAKPGLTYVSITDSGHGIPVNIADRMMDPFFSTKEVGRGTGLGLSISRGIIEDHGGRLWYDRESPNTRFVIELPVEEIQTAVKSSSIAVDFGLPTEERKLQ